MCGPAVLWPVLLGNKESISALVNLGGRGMGKASFLGKRAGNTTWKNQTKLLLFPSGSEQAGNIKVVLSLPEAHRVFLFFFFFGDGVWRLVYMAFG